jgi:hypothetical protein
MALVGIDTLVTGEAARLAAPVVMKRATACAPQGWAGILTLAVEERGGRQVVTCRAGDRNVELMAGIRGRPTFTYSSDGRAWSPLYSSDPSAFDDPAQLRYLRLYVRLASPGEIDILDSVSSGPQERWVRDNGLF